MVTTRSADKRARMHDKTEDLALRSKPDDALSVQDLSPDLNSPSLLRAKSKIIVNVPPPQTSTELGQISTSQIDPEFRPVDESASEMTTREMNVPENEVPDSQESPSKLGNIKDSMPQSDYVTVEEQHFPVNSEVVRKRKRGNSEPVNSGPPVTEIASDQAVTATHRHFDSADLDEDQRPTELISIEVRHKKSVEQADSEDDDAPEVATTKHIFIQNTNRTKRRSRTSKPIVELQNRREFPRLVAREHDRSIDSATTYETVPQAKATSSINIDGDQEPEPAMSPTSDEINDTAFVTARTHRHFDVLASPQNDLPQLVSPSINHVANTIHDTVSFEQTTNLPVSNLSKKQLTPKASALSVELASHVMGSNKLPAKAINSLEQYRRQIQKSRNERKGHGRQQINFKLQANWRQKRSHFVVKREELST